MAGVRLPESGRTLRHSRPHHSRLLGTDWMLSWTVLDKDRPWVRKPRMSTHQTTTYPTKTVYVSWLRWGVGLIWGTHPSRDGG